MLSAYLFDQRQGKAVESWAETLADLQKSQVLWLDLQGSDDAESQEVQEALGIEGLAGLYRDDERELPEFDQRDEHIKLTAVGVTRDKDGSAAEPVPFVCFVGRNWLVSAHADEVEVIEEFRERAEGDGELGVLDAPSFLAALLEWVVTSYLRAFDEIDLELEEFDLNVLQSTPADAEKQMRVLVDARSRISRLRRSLAPHRDVFTALSHSEFDPVSTEESAQRFTELAAKVNHALTAARDTKDAVNGSFDILLARSGYRTNETVKILTLASVLLLPGTLVAGVAGMNVNISMRVFAQSPLFWVVCTAFALMSLGTLAVARRRHWI